MQKLEAEMSEYTNILLNKPEGKPGREYLRKRHITRSTAIAWHLGFCPVGYHPECYKDETNYMFWTKMYGGLTIPVFDANKKLVTISRRKVIELNKIKGYENFKQPKYDHYPFNARAVLFGLNMNQGNMFLKNSAVVTEGQLDVISAWQKGIKIVCSSFGAHCSENHLILLNRYVDNIYLIYDNDDAGQRGQEKTKEICKQFKISVKFKKMFKEGEDLDNWVQTHTKEEFFDKLYFDKYKYLDKEIKKIERSK